jgi:cupin 2 domain-containing protein
VTNLFDDLPDSLAEELVDVLAQGKDVRIERIVSTGQASPPGFWYDQDETEWVVLLRGEAQLRFQKDDRLISLRPGDHMLVPAGCRHRVESTSPDETTVWLAVFFRSE